MRFRLVAVAVALLMAIPAPAPGVNTPVLDLERPAHLSENWHLPLNDNATKIDAAATFRGTRAQLLAIVSPPTSQAAVVTDCATITCAAGGGSTKCMARYDGSAWVYGPCQPHVIVTDTPYSADPTGGTLSTDAIQAAIDALEPTGGTIHFPCGTYHVTSTTPATTAALSINAAGLTLQGENRDCAILRFPDGSEDIRLLGVGTRGTPTVTGLTIRDLTFDGNGANWGPTAGRNHNAITRGALGTVTNTLIENVRFRNFYKVGFTNTSVISWGANTWDGLQIRNSILTGNRALGINLFCTSGTCGRFAIEDVTIDNTGATDASPQQNVLIGATVTGGGTINNVLCTPTCAGACVMVAAPNVTLSGSIADGCTTNQFVVTGAAARNVTVTGNVSINGGDGGFGLEAAAATDGPRYVTFSGNVARSNTVAGLYVRNSKHVRVSSNIFDGNCTGGSAGDVCAGIYVVGEASHTSTSVHLTENSTVDTQAVPTQKYGVALASTFVDGVRVVDGEYTGNTVAGYRLNASTNTRITGYTGGTLSLLNAPTYSLSGLNPPGVTFANLGTPQNGSSVYCSNCTKATPCAGGGPGAVAKRLNAAWDCN